jgi:hypothetical protein
MKLSYVDFRVRIAEDFVLVLNLSDASGVRRESERLTRWCSALWISL